MSKLRQQIIKLKKNHPTWGYKKISQELKCDSSTVRYHLNAEYRKKQLAFRVNRRLSKKKILVSEMGGKCEKCGYNRSIKALQFHHKNPHKKEYTISERQDFSIEKVRREVRKCVLVCANCHFEIHESLKLE